MVTQSLEDGEGALLARLRRWSRRRQLAVVVPHAFADHGRVGMQRTGIEIALQRDPIPIPSRRIAEFDPPVEGEDVGAGFH